jgi:hypothetical protein
MPLPGGATDKFGNRYEGLWTNGTKLSILVKAAREQGAGGGGECILKFLPTQPVLSASFSLLVKLPAPGASTPKKTLIFVTFGIEQ